MSVFLGIMAAAGVAAAQGPSLIWQSREFLTDAQGQPVFGPDAGVDVVTWQEPGVGTWIYVTGYHTTASGAEVIATYKYQFDPATGQNPQWERRAFFPDPEFAVGRHRGAAITVDAATGEVYVVGEGVGANGVPDYITIKYDKDLDPTNFPPGRLWPSQGDGLGVRRYNAVGGPDRAVDVLFFSGLEPGEGDVVVTGTSWGGPGTGYDIATLRYGPDGEFSDKWPAHHPALGPQGIRRYNNVLINGSDRAAEMGFINVAEPEQCGGQWVAVAGTTWNGSVNQDDFVLIRYGADGDPGVGVSTCPGWTRLFNGPAGGNDQCTGILAFGPDSNISWVGQVGVSIHPETSAAAGFGAGPLAAPANTDFSAVLYWEVLGQPLSFWDPDPVTGSIGRLWDGPLASSAEWCNDGDLSNVVWLTGRTPSATGKDLATVIWDTDKAGTFLGADIQNIPEDEDDEGMAIHVETGRAWVAGWALIPPNTDPFSHYLLLEYIQDGSGAPVVQWGALWPGKGMENKAQAITTFGPGFFNFFVTGVSEAFASSHDIGTIRVKRP